MPNHPNSLSIPAVLISLALTTPMTAQGIQDIATPKQIDASLPNVLLIGDSISIGYTKAVREALRGEANVFRPPTNCGPTSKGVAELDAWLGDRNWAVIHFNFGLHDLKFMGKDGTNLADPEDPASSRQIPPQEYVANLTKIVDRLESTGAALIWRETSPVPPGSKGRIAGDAVFYNQLAREVIASAGDIDTDPMHDYASQSELAALQRAANVHYTTEGSQKLGEKVASAIRKRLP